MTKTWTYKYSGGRTGEVRTEDDLRFYVEVRPPSRAKVQSGTGALDAATSLEAAKDLADKIVKEKSDHSRWTAGSEP